MILKQRFQFLTCFISHRGIVIIKFENLQLCYDAKLFQI